MKFGNYMILDFPSKSTNEAFARSAVACFASQMDPTLEELGDIRTAVSEAVTNCIVHAYPGGLGVITMTAALYEDGLVKITIADKGVGIADVSKAMEPLYTTGDPDERAGLGFAVMQSFMDGVQVRSKPGKGTRVVLKKKLEVKA